MEKLDALADQPVQACSTSPKLTKIERTSPVHIEDWTNQQAQPPSTMITPPPTITTSCCDTLNCSCCDYDGQYYPPSSSSAAYNSHYYSSSSTSSSSQQQPTSSPHMTVNVPVVANFQVNVNTSQSGYPLANSNNHQHYNASRKANMYYQQQPPPQQQSPLSPSSYYRNGYPTAMKYNQPPSLMYHPQQYSLPSQTFMENPNHFPMSSSHHHDFVYGHRQHHSLAYNTINVNHQSNGHIYHQL